MAAKVELSTVAEDKLSAFASSLLMDMDTVKYTRDILGLRSTFKDQNKLPADVRNQLIEKMNRDPDGTIKQAQAMIDKNPAVLTEFNKDPMKLAAAMGVKPSAPAAIAPTTPTSVKQEAQAPKDAPSTTANEPAASKKPEAAAVAAVPAAAKSVETRPLTDAQIETESQILAVHQEIRGMPGYKDLMDRAAKDPALDRALTAMRNGKEGGSPDDTLKSLTEFRDQAKADPKFFTNAVAMIDSTPSQMRESVFSQIAENPDLGRRALNGDAGAKMSLMMGGGQGGLGGLFSGEGMKGFGEMLANLLPRLLEGIKEIFGKLMGGLEKFSQSPGLMRMGNDPDLTRQHGQVVDKTLGTDSSKKPVLDASKPNDPATPMADLGKPTTAVPEQPRKLEVQQPGAPVAATS